MPGPIDRLKIVFGWGSAASVKKAPTVDTTDPIYSTHNPSDMYHDMMQTRKRNRKNRYDVYDSMDKMSDVASILDAYAEDATLNDNKTEATVWIEGKNSKIVKELNTMLKDLDIEQWIEGVTRDLAKHGDDFSRIVGGPDVGVVSLEWLDPRDLERVENREGILLGFETTKGLGDYKKKLGDDKKAMPKFTPWDILHFRIYKQKRLPYEKNRHIYGTSLLWASDRIAKQIKILDDLLMIVRLTRSLDRKIYYVDVGRAPVEEEVRILKRWRRSLKRKTFIDPVQGRFDSRFNPYAWCITGDTSISLLDGRERTVVQLLDEYGTDKKFWVYSRDKNGKIVPGHARCVGKTRLNAELVKVTIDNEKSVRCTPDHRWMMKDGSYKEAKDLKPGDSLSPLYRRVDDHGYEMIMQQYDKGSKWDPTHKSVASYIYGEDLIRKHDPPLDSSGVNVVHHHDFNKKNNTPDNLVPMGRTDHYNYHMSNAHRNFDRSRVSPEVAAEWERRRLEGLRAAGPSIKRSEAMEVRWEDPEFYSMMSDRISDSWKDDTNRKNRIEAIAARNSKKFKEEPEHREKMLKNLRSRYYRLVEEVVEIMLDNGFDPLSEWDLAKEVLFTAGLIPGNTPKWKRAEKYLYDEDNNKLNHKVLRVDYLIEKEDTFDIEVDGNHNFAVTNGVFLHNSEDEFWPTKENTNSRVETIEGIGSVGEQVDIDHFRDKFFGSFRAPKAYFGYEGDINAKSTLSSQSIRWARAVNSLQRGVKVGITRLCQVHLGWKNLETDVDNFKVMMVAPSIIELLDRLEAWQNIIDVAERMSTMGETMGLDKLEWTKYILEHVMWLSDNDVKKFSKLLEEAAKEGDLSDENTPPADDEPKEEPPEELPLNPEKEPVVDKGKVKPPPSPVGPPPKKIPPKKIPSKKIPPNKPAPTKKESLQEVDEAINRVIRGRVIRGAREGELPSRKKK